MIRPLKQVLFEVLTFLAGLHIAGCSYEPEEVHINLENMSAKPQSHIMAFAVDYAIMRWPNGAINTFPNGGKPQVIRNDARIYVVDIDLRKITLAAEIIDYDGLPT